MFHNLKQWFYNFYDIYNPSSGFIFINETNKQGCLFFKTCNNQKDICLVFTELLVRTYLNLTKNIDKVFTKKYKHLYCLYFFNDKCFSHAYCLMHKVLCRMNPDIYLYFVPSKDYNSNCFKIINWHYLKYIKDKEKLKQKSKAS